ncbi:MAG: BrnT family toxin [Planctomycetes bacterium]|nr:BrnT family toxin [Planctomycetota bacterium]
MDGFEALGKCEGFAWDRHNTEKNWSKHGVTPSECEEALFNTPIVVVDDDKHSKDENRYYALCRTDSQRLLFLVFTVRNNFIRVISARAMSRKERKIFEEYEKDTEIQD